MNKKTNVLSRVRPYRTLINGSPAHISLLILQELEWAEVLNSSRELHSFITVGPYLSFFIGFVSLR